MNNDDRVVSVGDLVDFHSFATKWSPNPDMYSPGHEIEAAIKELKPLYREIPKMDITLGNHERRVWVKFRCAGAPQLILRRMQEILCMPEGYKIHQDGLEIGNIYIWHGEGLSAGQIYHAANKYKMNCAFGHFHSRAGVVFSQTRPTRKHESLLWSMNVGMLADSTHPYMDYAKHIIEKGVLGLGVVINGVPYFEPMPPKWI